MNSQDDIVFPKEAETPVSLQALDLADPKRVEAVLAKMPVADQIRSVLELRGKDRLTLLFLSPKGVEVVRALPPQELYFMVKDIGEEDCLPVLSVMSPGQLQYFFDLEWWKGDKFIPHRALKWLKLLDRCDNPQVLNWFLTEEFEIKVMVLQSLIVVHLTDEADDGFPPEVEGLPHFTMDGVYHIFVKIPEAGPVLKNFFKLLRLREEKVYFSLLDAVIWYPITQTVDQAYKWRLTRTAEKGIPEFEEAFSIYSRLGPESLQAELASPGAFSEEGRYPVPPSYPLDKTAESTFFGKCLGLLEDRKRRDVIRWELVYLGNKVMVADREDPADLANLKTVMAKVLGYVNMGLELGAGGDPRKGRKLLERTWLQALFQVGYGRLIQLKWQVEKIRKEQKEFFRFILADSEWEQLDSLAGPFPQKGDWVDDKTCNWRDFRSLAEIEEAERFLRRTQFQARFCKHCLGLTEADLETAADTFDFPENKEDVDFRSLFATAFARFILFKTISWEPLAEAAARAFLQMIFLPGIPPAGPGEIDASHLQSFHQHLLNIPMAWTEEDRADLDQALSECADHLKNQFGGIDPKGRIEWKYIRGLLVKGPERGGP